MRAEAVPLRSEGESAGSDVSAGSLKTRAISGTLWSVAGQGSAQILRLGSNLVMTRLLVPEMFGLMALVHVFLQGLQMFSDLGVQSSIVQNKRGTEPAFLNTAWTFQILRGVVLWLITLLAARPLAAAYGEPVLVWLMPIVGASALIAGFNSTSLATESRSIRVRGIVLIDVGSQVAAIAAMIAYALYSPTVWALATGGIVGAASKALASHLFLPGIRNRIHWEPGAAGELFRFGRWIFISTAFTFLTMQGDRLVLSTFVPVALLGIYSIAVQLSTAVNQIVQTISGKVLFSLFARILEEDPALVRRRIRKVRVALLAAVIPIPALLVVYGDLVVRVLYGQDYWEAGWMLQVLSAGVVAQTINYTFSPVVLATGDSFRHMVQLIVSATLILVCMIAGAWYDGARGLVVGLSISRWLVYPAVVWAVRRTGVWMPSLDFGAVLYMAAWVGIGTALHPFAEAALEPLIEWLRTFEAGR